MSTTLKAAELPPELEGIVAAYAFNKEADVPHDLRKVWGDAIQREFDGMSFMQSVCRGYLSGSIGFPNEANRFLNPSTLKAIPEVATIVINVAMGVFGVVDTLGWNTLTRTPSLRELNSIGEAVLRETNKLSIEEIDRQFAKVNGNAGTALAIAPWLLLENEQIKSIMNTSPQQLPRQMLDKMFLCAAWLGNLNLMDKLRSHVSKEVAVWACMVAIEQNKTETLSHILNIDWNENAPANYQVPDFYQWHIRPHAERSIGACAYELLLSSIEKIPHEDLERFFRVLLTGFKKMEVPNEPIIRMIGQLCRDSSDDGSVDINQVDLSADVGPRRSGDQNLLNLLYDYIGENERSLTPESSGSEEFFTAPTSPRSPLTRE
ncbi:MAG TPA: hypothetical protein VLF94_06230 [Chlamydiales bacterium]|nr:hypothetical protein [Chlamydiales bacterium]